MSNANQIPTAELYPGGSHQDIHRTLRENHEQLCAGLHGDIFAILMGAHFYAHQLARKSMLIRHDELPAKLRKRLSAEQFDEIALRVARTARLGTDLVPPDDIRFPADEEKERQRRVALYRQQWQGIEKRYGVQLDEEMDELLRLGPAARPVVSEHGEQFPSCRAAALAMNRLDPRYARIQRGDIRKVIGSGRKVAGRRWRYLSSDKQVVDNGHGLLLSNPSNPAEQYRSKAHACQSLRLTARELEVKIAAGELIYQPAPASDGAEKPAEIFANIPQFPQMVLFKAA